MKKNTREVQATLVTQAQAQAQTQIPILAVKVSIFRPRQKKIRR
jgi:ribosomal protein S3